MREAEHPEAVGMLVHAVRSMERACAERVVEKEG